MRTGMKVTHTPGPWKATSLGVLTEDGWLIADCGDGQDGDWDESRALANAHLIAAAPLLLEAAEAQLSAWDSGAIVARDGLVPSAYQRCAANYEMLRTAIAAARGEA